MQVASQTQSRVRWLTFHRCLDRNHFHCCRLGILITAEAAGNIEVADNVEVQSSANFLPTAHIAGDLDVSTLFLLEME